MSIYKGPGNNLGWGPTAVGPRYFRQFAYSKLDAQSHQLHSVHNTFGVMKKTVKQRVVELQRMTLISGGTQPCPFSTSYHWMRLTSIPSSQLNPFGCFEKAHDYDR